MTANDCNFYKDILCNKRYFYIPVYQRNYSWRDIECKTLMEDLLKVYNNEYIDHFIGTIVYKSEDGNSDNLNVIDGQQRLTTMFLLCKAILDTTTDDIIKEEMHEIIFDKRDRHRLVPIKSDNEVYKCIMENNLDLISNHSSRIFQNYVYFKNYLTNSDLDYEKLVNALNKLPAIRMELHRDDNPQVIFESINSTGLSLSIADLIRNYLLMNEEYAVQEELFNKYWYKFEQKLGLENLVMFFEHFLNIKLPGKSINRNDMYTHFKNYHQLEKFTTRSLLGYVEKYVEAYYYLVDENRDIILESKSDEIRINEVRREIIELNNNVVNMFLMPLICNFNDGVITSGDLLYSFELSLSYIFRRSVVGLAPSSMQKIFKYLYVQVKERSDISFKDAIEFAFITSKASTNGRFPNNEEFKAALSNRNLYGKFSNLFYLLYKLENHNNKPKIDPDSLTIEHILPQTLTPYWKEVLGSEYKILHEEFMNDLGNLTLTSYNSEMKNFDFEVKKKMLEDEAHIVMNRYFLTKENWNVTEIENRGIYLANEAVNIWKFPNDIEPKIAQMIEEQKYSSVTLTEQLTNYISIKPVSISIKEIEIKALTFRELLFVVSKYAMDINPEKFINTYIDSENYKNSSTYFISENEELVYQPRKLGNYYIDCGGSGFGIHKMCNKILSEFEVSSDEVIIKYYKS